MSFINTMIAFFFTFYTFFFVTLFSKNKRVELKNTNIELEKLRLKPFKTIEEQKRFIELKNPTKPKFKFTWRWAGLLFVKVIFFLGVLRLYRFIFAYFNITFSIWHLFAIVIFFPILTNLILGKFNLQKSDLLTILRGAKK